ncbi:hypothetical protein EJV44_15475 [Ancylobacter aquaticus]|nr:hypothetical protein EJV44_15475 [Ancylobacter aquaticus]
MLEDQFPPVPEALVAALERRFPDRAPNMEASDREVWAGVGSVRVVRFLRQQLEQQKEELLDYVHVEASQA